jgi:hypothetical protein
MNLATVGAFLCSKNNNITFFITGVTTAVKVLFLDKDA